MSPTLVFWRGGLRRWLFPRSVTSCLFVNRRYPTMLPPLFLGSELKDVIDQQFGMVLVMA